MTWELSNTPTGIGNAIYSSGKLTVPEGLEGKTEDFTVTATAKDGSGAKASYTIRLRPPTTKFEIKSRPPVNDVYDVYNLYTIRFTSDCTAPVSCASSSPEVAAPSIVYTPYNPNTKTGGTGSISFMATEEGYATFTVKALDTSDQTCEIMCTFQNNEG